MTKIIRTVTVDRLESALRASWGRDTCDHPDEWTAENPSKGQCGVSSLVAQDFLGGDLLRSEVFLNGVADGYHYALLLPDGELFDPTSEQFTPTEVVGPRMKTERISTLPKNGADRYLLLSKRVKCYVEI